jgi:hypothetical protein
MYAIEMGAGGMMYMLRVMKIGSVIQKLLREGGKHMRHEDCISLLSFFQNKGSQLFL